MSERVLVSLPDGRWLALSREAFDAALAEGTAAIGPPAAVAAPEEPLVEAAELAAVLKLPQTWIEQAARAGRIPAVKAGRWRRFRRSDVERALQAVPP